MRDANIQVPSMGLLSYPILQAADILMVRADLVPVGKDQASHIEVTREIAKEFNRTYKEVFPIPEALIPDEVGTLPGTDGKAKMSKSVGNVINLSDDSQTVRKKVMGMYTDPNRVHGDEPGQIEGNPVFVYLDSFKETKRQKDKVEELKERYKKGTVKDVEVKEFLVQVLEEFLQPVRVKRQEFEQKPEYIEEVLKDGTKKARVEAKKTLDLVKKAMGLDLRF